MSAITKDEFMQLLREGLPRLLREHPEVRHEVFGILLEVFPGRQEFTAVLEEIRALRSDVVSLQQGVGGLREDMGHLREEVDGLREDVGRLQKDVDGLREDVGGLRKEVGGLRRDMDRLELHMTSLGLRVGRGLEHVIRGIVEEFSGQTFTSAERLVLTDREGEVFGVKGAQVEFDLFASDGAAYLVEVKSHVEPDDVLSFWRKFGFAARMLGREVTPMIIALSAEEKAEKLMRELGIQYIVRAHV
jgi:hypothetical protein